MTTDPEALVVAGYVFADEYPVPARGGRKPPERRHADRGRQLPSLPAAERVRRLRPLRIREVAAPLRLRVRLVLLTDERGLPLGYTIVPANENEYEPLADLLTGSPTQIVIGDKGFWGRDYARRLAAAGTTLLTPDRTRTANNERRERALASTRLVIESVFSNLKEQMQLERHLARTPAGLALRIAQRILALTLGILLNTISGRPARALAAYDGR
jgi:DDE family transposase